MNDEEGNGLLLWHNTVRAYDFRLTESIQLMIHQMTKMRLERNEGLQRIAHRRAEYRSLSYIEICKGHQLQLSMTNIASLIPLSLHLLVILSTLIGIARISCELEVNKHRGKEKETSLIADEVNETSVDNQGCQQDL